MNVQKARLEDAEEIFNLQKLAYQSEAEIYNDYTIPPLTQTLEKIRHDFSDHYFLKAVVNDQIAGSVKANSVSGTCFIGRLIVHPNYQRRGIGTQLMHTIEEQFQTNHRYELFTGHKSEGNLRLYRRLGYKEFKREKVHEVLTLIFMEKLTSIDESTNKQFSVELD